jgi:CubicO group peptidase (beta-lactamase class C family)
MSRLPQAAAETVGMSAERLANLDPVISAAIDRGEAPGAVVLVGRRGRVVYEKAYGLRSVEPAAAAMTADTVFDLASLTKVVAGATAVMVLIDRGRVDPAEPAVRHLPEFTGQGKDEITVEHLLIHRSGLIADNSILDYRDGRASAWKAICALKLRDKPGARFVYSDVGYIVLGELVARLGGKALDAFCREHIFRPAGMMETVFKPVEELRRRCAPTERRAGRWLTGEVHDPRAAALGGVAGHAGLFSTAQDLAIYSQMILDGGAVGGARVLSAAAVRAMTARRGPVGEGRGYGWDIDTSYSFPRGDLFAGGLGHTGFTGTSLWLDQQTGVFVVLLTSRVHPFGKGGVVRLRARVANVVAGAVAT